MKVSVSVVVCLLLWVFDIVHCEVVEAGRLVFSSLDTSIAAVAPSPNTGLTPPLALTAPENIGKGLGAQPDAITHAPASFVTNAPAPANGPAPVHHAPNHGYGVPKPPSKECKPSQCTDTILVPSHSFDSHTIVDNVTKAVVKHILVQSTFTDVVEELVTVPVCFCSTTTVPITQTFRSTEITMILEGCSPTYSEAMITTLSTIRGDTVSFNDCTSQYDKIILPRLYSTVVDDWVNTFEFTSTKVTKTEMDPVHSETRLTVCTATCEENGHENPPRNRYLPPAPYHG